MFLLKEQNRFQTNFVVLFIKQSNGDVPLNRVNQLYMLLLGLLFSYRFQTKLVVIGIHKIIKKSNGDAA